MVLKRFRGPIDEKEIDQDITRDSELVWNNISNKPTTFDPSTHTHGTLNTQSKSDFSDLIGGISGFYQSGVNGVGLNSPMPSWCHLINVEHTNVAVGNKYAMQISSGYFSQRLFFRNIAASNNPVWNEILHTGNYVENWITPTYSSNFTSVPVESPLQSFTYRKNFVSNAVDFCGSIRINAALNANTYYLAFTLPFGYRPTKNRSFPIKLNDGAVNQSFTDATAVINQLGEVYIMPTINRSAGTFSLEFSMPL